MKINTTSLMIRELLFDGKIYAVPLFQRSYSWGVKQISDFLSDLRNIYEGSERDYFMGSMVFTPHEEKNKIKILDGQQRIATILLFLAALRDVLKQTDIQKGPEWVEEINKIIFMRNPVTLSKNAKLELNREDRIFFEKITIEGVVSETKYNSHKLIQKAYYKFKDIINKKIIEGKDKFVEKILDIILNYLLMIKIEVDTDVNAHMIFETLNDRGLELSVADLVKNYIFSISSSQDLELIVSMWKYIADQVGDHNITKFLRHFWISSFELARKDELYKKLKEKVGDTNVKDFMEQLNKEVTIYSNLNNPTHEFWEDNEVEILLEELNILKVEQVYVLLLALYEKFYKNNRSLFKRILQILINSTFRYNTICNLNPNEMERVYSNLAIKIRKSAINIKGVIEKIIEITPVDEMFFGSFIEKDIKNSKQARYILLKISNYLLTEQEEEEKTTNIREVNLEHIIPKKPDKKWQKFFREKNINPEELTYRLGNMTILLKEYNRRIANKFFPEKKKMYEKSKLPLNNSLKKYKEFGPMQVNRRQGEMTNIAIKIWGV